MDERCSGLRSSIASTQNDTVHLFDESNKYVTTCFPEFDGINENPKGNIVFKTVVHSFFIRYTFIKIHSTLFCLKVGARHDMPVLEKTRVPMQPTDGVSAQLTLHKKTVMEKSKRRHG